MDTWEALGIERLQARVLWRILRREMAPALVTIGVGALVTTLLLIAAMGGKL